MNGLFFVLELTSLNQISNPREKKQVTLKKKFQDTNHKKIIQKANKE
jgi:hypothetical protein